MKQRISMLAAWLTGIMFLTGLDQYTKHLAVLRLKDKEPFVLINGVFEFYYSENRGAAFGILQGRQEFFFVIAAVVCAFSVYAVWQMAGTGSRRYLWLGLCTTFLTAGAIGNMVDRVMQGFVVDFLYFKLIDFPIFNVADIYVTVSAFFLMLLMGFVYKDEELQIFRLGRRGEQS